MIDSSLEVLCFLYFNVISFVIVKCLSVRIILDVDAPNDSLLRLCLPSFITLQPPMTTHLPSLGTCCLSDLGCSLPQFRCFIHGLFQCFLHFLENRLIVSRVDMLLDSTHQVVSIVLSCSQSVIDTRYLILGLIQMHSLLPTCLNLISTIFNASSCQHYSITLILDAWCALITLTYF